MLFLLHLNFNLTQTVQNSYFYILAPIWKTSLTNTLKRILYICHKQCKPNVSSLKSNAARKHTESKIAIKHTLTYCHDAHQLRSRVKWTDCDHPTPSERQKNMTNMRSTHNRDAERKMRNSINKFKDSYINEDAIQKNKIQITWASYDIHIIELKYCAIFD